MADKVWKQAERRGAAYFGSTRNSLSGGNSKVTRSDSIHPTLYLEQKHAVRHAVWTLLDQTRPKAKKEKKVPVILLHSKGRPGFMICVHSDHALEVLQELLKRDQKAKEKTGKRRRRKKCLS